MNLTRNQIQILIGLIASALLAALLYFFYIFVSDRLTEDLRVNAQNRATLFAGAIRGALQRHIIVPQILAEFDNLAPSMIEGEEMLNDELSRISQALDGADIVTVLRNGNVTHSSNPELIGTTFLESPIWEQLLQSGQGTVFNTELVSLFHAARVDDPETRTPIGLTMVRMDFAPFADLWRRLGVDVMMVSQPGDILLASPAGVEGQNFREFMRLGDNFEFSELANGRILNWNEQDNFVFSTELGVNGWKLIYSVPAAETRSQINAVMALAIMGLGFLVVMTLYVISRRAALESARFKRESEELRALNTRLLTEVEQRQRAEQELQSAEQSLEQSSKLAVIGQMSAAVGHELNQPLAAMRTYLGGSRMLLRRSRFLEAAQNLSRIEDLLDRMGAITRQMRSFARAHEDEIKAFDLREALANAFRLMTPQLGQMKVNIIRELPDKIEYVMGDQLRVEQIIINLLRNALEAVEAEDEPEIHITLDDKGGFACLKLSDNGTGLTDPDKLFEPFFTTKAPGQGLGLGLAISASYAKDMGGNLRARNRETKGAIFELTLPFANETRN